MGLMSQLRTYLMIAIQQSTSRRAATKALGHLLDLDLHFHLTRKTGEVWRKWARPLLLLLQNIASLARHPFVNGFPL